MKRLKIKPRYQEDIEYMLESSDRVTPIEEVATELSNLQAPFVQPFGGVISRDGKIYSLNNYATHGVLIAMLCPEKAYEYGIAQPTGGVGNWPKFAYQSFELDLQQELPVIRITCRSDLHISYGRGDNKPNLAQIAALTTVIMAERSLTKTVHTCDASFKGADLLRYLIDNFNGVNMLEEYALDEPDEF